MPTVTVRGATPAGLVALWDTTQPAGELFLVSGDVARVELTLAVSSALARGALVLVPEPVTGDSASEAPAPATPAEAPAPRRGRK